MNHAMRFTDICARQITGIYAITQHLKKPCLKLKWMQFVASRGIAENRVCMVEGRRFFLTCNLFGMQEEQENIICQTMLFFICFRKYKMTWNPQLGVTHYQVNQNFLQLLALLASGSFHRTMTSLFATALICDALGILHCSICKLSIASVCFNLRRNVHAHWRFFGSNLPRLVKLALSTARYGLNITHVLSVLFKIVIFYLATRGFSSQVKAAHKIHSYPLLFQLLSLCYLSPHFLFLAVVKGLGFPSWYRSLFFHANTH